jgi:hypothetical protein
MARRTHTDFDDAIITPLIRTIGSDAPGGSRSGRLAVAAAAVAVRRGEIRVEVLGPATERARDSAPSSTPTDRPESREPTHPIDPHPNRQMTSPARHHAYTFGAK